MALLRELMRLDAPHAVEAILINPPAGLTTRQWYARIQLTISEKFNPAHEAFMNGLDVPAVFKSITDLKVLNETQFDFFPLQFRELLGEILDGIEGLQDYQKVFLYNLFYDAAYNSAERFIVPLYETRAQQLAEELQQKAAAHQQSRILVPDAPTPGKLIRL